MSGGLTKLQKEILSEACREHGQTLVQMVKRFPGRDATTIRRNVYKLGALGYLSLKEETRIYPNDAAKKIVGNGARASEDGGEH